MEKLLVVTARAAVSHYKIIYAVVGVIRWCHCRRARLKVDTAILTILKTIRSR
ncbi:MAG: hypothetical protein R2874_16055 [Desulfobacterales bacterium]